jgi:hypothetical protein
MGAMEGGGGVPGSGVPGGGSASANAAPDFTSPTTGARSFLSALKAKDSAKLAETVALRAEYESSTEERKNMFKALRLENLPADEVDRLAQIFEGMELTNTPTNAKSSGQRGVVVGKSKENKYHTRTIYLRKEKDGWKVMDYSRERIENMGTQETSKKQGKRG